MVDINFDVLKSKTNSIFKLAVLAGKRAEEISQGAGKLVETPLETKPTTTALKEICEDKVYLKKTK